MPPHTPGTDSYSASPSARPFARSQDHLERAHTSWSAPHSLCSSSPPSPLLPTTVVRSLMTSLATSSGLIKTGKTSRSSNPPGLSVLRQTLTLSVLPFKLRSRIRSRPLRPANYCRLQSPSPASHGDASPGRPHPQHANAPLVSSGATRPIVVKPGRPNVTNVQDPTSPPSTTST
jgi:hypothetical protein